MAAAGARGCYNNISRRYVIKSSRVISYNQLIWCDLIAGNKQAAASVESSLIPVAFSRHEYVTIGLLSAAHYRREEADESRECFADYVSALCADYANADEMHSMKRQCSALYGNDGARRRRPATIS